MIQATNVGPSFLIQRIASLLLPPLATTADPAAVAPTHRPVFYLHSRLLERAAKLNSLLGEESMQQWIVAATGSGETLPRSRRP